MNHCEHCTLCCKVMGVTELDKPANQWCPHCAIGAGCKQYDSRPETCSGFECLWLQTQYQRHGEPKMPAGMRPDRCGVVIDVRTDKKGLVFHVDHTRPEAYARGLPAAYINALVAKGEDVIVVIGEKRRLITRRELESK